MTMRTWRVAGLLVAIGLASWIAVAEDAPEMSAEQQAAMAAWQKAMTPGPQHAALAKMAGEFTTTVTWYTEPGGEPQVSAGAASRKMILGGRVLEEMYRGTFMDQPFEGRGLTGYDNVAGQWWSSWVDNMSTGLMTSYGEWDLDAGVATFHGEYVDPETGEIQGNRTVITVRENGDEHMAMFMLTATGEFKSMEILYQRR